jgi:ABC-type bacteriocin/lantibiotic exporter with double-glycine peptidase domain
MKKIQSIFRQLKTTSSLISFKGKKRRILLSSLLSNLIVVLDILIIFIFSSYFNSETEIIYLSEFINSYDFLFPSIVILRFIFIYTDTMNIQYLRLGIEKDLKIQIIKSTFKDSNYTISDMYFYTNVLSSSIGGFFQYLTTLFGSFIQLILFSSYLIFTKTDDLIYLAAFGVIIFPISRYFIKLGRRNSEIAYGNNKKINSELEKIIENLFLIKILNTNKREIQTIENNTEKYIKAQFNNQKYGTLNSLLPITLTVFTLSLLINSPRFGFITLELIGILLRTFQSLGVFNKNLSLTTTTLVFLENFEEFSLNQKKLSNFSLNRKKVISEKYSVTLSNISFNYFKKDEKVFKDLDLKIEKNKHYLITGPNGSGKSTLVGLISGALNPQLGEIDYDFNSIGYVSSNPLIIRSSLKENLCYGTKINDDNELLDLLKKFKLFDEEINMQILEKQISNKTLSMGQMQKIAFIRSVLLNPDLLILDESTANLDLETRKFVIDLINSLNCTILNITHNEDEFKEFDFKIKLSKGSNFNTVIEII